jgi:predicted nucleic acid-binding protein
LLGLDEGEREAILLAHEMKADLFVIDDEVGWKQWGDIPVMRTLAVPELADDRGFHSFDTHASRRGR